MDSLDGYQKCLLHNTLRLWMLDEWYGLWMDDGILCWMKNLASCRKEERCNLAIGMRLEKVSERSNFVDWASFGEFRSSEEEAMHSSPTTHQPHQQCWGSPPATLVRSLCVSQTQESMLLDALWCAKAIGQRDVEFDGTNLCSSDRVEISTVA